MKKALPMPTDVKRGIALRAEQAVLEQLPVDRKALKKAAKYLEPKKLKLLTVAFLGGAAFLSLLGTAGHERLYRAAVAKELKRQLAPVNEKLDELQAQNDELRAQNEELKRRLDRA